MHYTGKSISKNQFISLSLINKNAICFSQCADILSINQFQDARFKKITGMNKTYELNSFPLQNLIHKAYTIEYTANQNKAYQCFPCIYPVISFLINGNLTFRDDNLTIYEKKQEVNSYIHFPYTNSFKIKSIGNVKEITFVISPLCFHYFTSFSDYDVKNPCRNMKEIFSKEKVEALEKQLLNTSNTDEQILEIETFLTQRLNENYKSDDFPLPSFQEIHNKIISLPPRSYYRKFKQLAFLGPKQFSKIIQLRKSLVDAKCDKSLSLTEIAYKNGYADQAHFIRSCKTMSQLSPSKIIKNFIDIESDNLWFM